MDAATSSPGHPLAYFSGKFGRMQVAPEAADLARVREGARTTGWDTGQAVDVDALTREQDSTPTPWTGACGHWRPKA